MLRAKKGDPIAGSGPAKCPLAGCIVYAHAYAMSQYNSGLPRVQKALDERERGRTKKLDEI